MEHQGKKIKEIANKKGILLKDIALQRGVSLQSVSNDFAKETLTLKAVKAYSEVLGFEVSDIVNETKQKSVESSNNFNVDLLKENNELRKEVAGLWRIIALSGIKVEKSQLNFNGGVSPSVLGNTNKHIFFDI